MPKISELGTTEFPSLEHFFPAVKDGETVQLSIQQVRDILNYVGTELLLNASGTDTIEQVIIALQNSKADLTAFNESVNAIATALALRVRVDVDQGLTADQKAQARTNIAAFQAPSGTAADYVRGDGTTAPLNKAAVGLPNVNNTSDADKPISTATQTALNGKQAALGYTPVRQGGGAGQSTSHIVRIGWDAVSRLLLQINDVNFGYSWPIDITGLAAGSNAVNSIQFRVGSIITNTNSSGLGTVVVSNAFPNNFIGVVAVQAGLDGVVFACTPASASAFNYSAKRPSDGTPIVNSGIAMSYIAFGN